MEPGEALRFRRELVEERIEARGIITQEALDPRKEVLPGRGRSGHKMAVWSPSNPRQQSLEAVETCFE